MVKVSIIIPVFNGVKYIRECIDSVICQTLRDIEIIVVDAGSTDGTLEILKEYEQSDNRVNLLCSDKKSMGYQYNIGMDAARGDYIGFLEADDYLAATMFEKLYLCIKENDLDYVKADFDMFIDKKERLFLNYHILSGPIANLYDTVICPSEYSEIVYRDVNMWNGIYKKEFLVSNKIRLNETPKASFQDMGFVLQTFIAARRAMYIKTDSYKYRRDNINSSVFDLKSILFVVQEFEYAGEYLKRLEVINTNTAVVIYRRFVDSFIGSYGKLPGMELFTDDVRDAIQRFKCEMLKWNERFAFFDMEKEGFNGFVSSKILLSNELMFDNLRKEIVKTEDRRFKDFYIHVKKYSNAVIFGAGETGTCCYGMLVKNDYLGVTCFVDNNSKLWKKQIMGLEVKNPNEVIKEANDYLYIIANPACWRDIHRQLFAAGVPETNICLAVTTIPHNALEISIN